MLVFFAALNIRVRICLQPRQTTLALKGCVLHHPYHIIWLLWPYKDGCVVWAWAFVPSEEHPQRSTWWSSLACTTGLSPVRCITRIPPRQLCWWMNKWPLEYLPRLWAVQRKQRVGAKQLLTGSESPSQDDVFLLLPYSFWTGTTMTRTFFALSQHALSSWDPGKFPGFWVSTRMLTVSVTLNSVLLTKGLCLVQLYETF